jgi:serine/threonine protein kinase
MGVVHKARQVSLNRIVALKMIKDNVYPDADQLNRFRSEVEAVARLQHPNIVQIYEVGEQDGSPFFAMEFVEGGSLAEEFGGHPLPSRQAAKLVQSLARTMHFAHEHGILHRDLKPANILLAHSDRTEAVRLANAPAEAECYKPKITDFGLAKRLYMEMGQTQSGAVLGTPSYMAPEQGTGKA